MKKNIMKKALALLVIVAMLIPCLPVIAAAEAPTYEASVAWYTEGVGGTIMTAADLAGFLSLAATKTFAGETIYLGADIEWNKNAVVDTAAGTFTADGEGSYYEWNTAFATGCTLFGGTFDGQGYTISGLYATEGTGFLVGMQGTEESPAQIKNVRFEDCYIGSTLDANRYPAVAVGRIFAYSAVEDVVVSGCVVNPTRSNGQAGGLAGQFASSAGAITVKDCVIEDVSLQSGGATGAFSTITGGKSAITVTFENCVNATAYQFVGTDNNANANVTYTVNNCVKVNDGVATLIDSENADPDAALSIEETNTTTDVEVEIEGVQTRANGTDKFDARFVSSITLPEENNITAIGFEIARTSTFVTETQDVKSATCEKVYKSIKAKFENNETKIIAATDFNGGEADYLATLVMTDIPATGLQSVVVRNYYVANGTTYYGDYAVVTFLDGQYLASGYVAYAAPAAE